MINTTHPIKRPYYDKITVNNYFFNTNNLFNVKYSNKKTYKTLRDYR